MKYIFSVRKKLLKMHFVVLIVHLIDDIGKLFVYVQIWKERKYTLL